MRISEMTFYFLWPIFMPFLGNWTWGKTMNFGKLVQNDKSVKDYPPYIVDIIPKGMENTPFPHDPLCLKRSTKENWQ